MPGDTLSEVHVPDNPAEDVLEQVVRAAHIAKEFKRLVIDLAVDDATDDLEDLFTNPEYVDKTGRIITDSGILHGEYTVATGRGIEINPVDYIQADVSLGTLDGGRVYSLYTSTAFDIPLLIEYTELPIVQNSLNVLANFRVEADGPRRSAEIPFWQLVAVEGLTIQVRRLMKTKRMVYRARGTEE